MLNEEIKAKLAADLPRDVVKTRSQAGQSLSYVSSDYVIRRLNEVFGPTGWTFLADPPREVYRGTRQGKSGENIVIVYEVRGTLRAEGIERVDVGVGQCDSGANAVAQGIEKALKEATTDALKRCARTLGNSFGLALYDKSGEGIGLSTAALALLDEVAQTDDLSAWWRDVQTTFNRLEADEKDVVKGAVAARRVELAARGAEPIPATVTQPAAQPAPQLPPSTAAANDVSPSRRELEARLARARSVESVVASVLSVLLTDPDRAAARPAIAAAAERNGVSGDALRGRLDAARKLQVPAAQWAVAADVLAELEAQGDVASLDAARKRLAPKATGLAGPLLDAIKRRSTEIRNAFGVPGALAESLIAEAQRATTMEALRAIHGRLDAAARAGTVTEADAQRVTDALNDRGETIAVQAEAAE